MEVNIKDNVTIDAKDEALQSDMKEEAPVSAARIFGSIRTEKL